MDQTNYSYSDHSEEMRSIRILAEQAIKEGAITSKLLEMFNRSLFGNGQPGIIQTIQGSIKESEKRLASIETKINKYIAYAVAGFFVIEFLTSTGTLTLQAILKGLAK